MDDTVQAVLSWLARGGDAYEIHIRAEMAKQEGAEFAFSDAYQPHNSRRTEAQNEQRTRVV